MFKELKLLKIAIALSLLFSLLYHRYGNKATTMLITPVTSFSHKDTIKFSIASNTSINEYSLKITNAITSKIILDTAISVKKTYTKITGKELLHYGAPHQEYHINKKLPQGLYTINKSPFIIKSEKKTAITFVVPVLNNLFYQKEGKAYFFEDTIQQMSWARNTTLDQWTKGLLPIIKQTLTQESYSFITDLDLDNEQNINTDVLVIFGRSVFWTPKMIENINKHIEKGGHLLLITSKSYYAGFCFNDKKKTVYTHTCNFVKPQTQEKIQTWRTHFPSSYFETILHSDYGGEAIDKYHAKIETPSHPLFNELNKDTLSIFGHYFMGIKKEMLSQKEYRLLASVPCKQNKYPNTIGGIIEFHHPNGGIVLSLGSEDFCIKDKRKETDLDKIISNAFLYLTKKQFPHRK